MVRRLLPLVSIFILVTFAAILLSSCGSNVSTAVSPGSSGSAASALDGKTLLDTRCSVCHSTERVTSSHKTATEWKTTVDRMIGNGAQLTGQEEQILVDFLAQKYK